MPWNVLLLVLKGRFQNRLEKEFTDEDLASFFLSWCDSGTFRWNSCFTKADELRNDSLQMNTIHLPRGSSTRPILYSRSWTGDRRKKRKEGRQFSSLLLILSTAMPDEAESITDIKIPRKLHYQIHWRPEQDAVYWIHLSTAQDAGQEFWQTGSNATVTNQSVPKECVVKVVSECGIRELLARQLTLRERPKVTVRPSWVHARSNNVSMLRETESKLGRRRPFNPNSSESLNCPKEEFEQSIDLRVDGIPNDETHKDEQYMQRIAEQVRNL